LHIPNYGPEWNADDTDLADERRSKQRLIRVIRVRFLLYAIALSGSEGQ
jgi:hypothetical protein